MKKKFKKVVKWTRGKGYGYFLYTLLGLVLISLMFPKEFPIWKQFLIMVFSGIVWELMSEFSFPKRKVYWEELKK